MLADPPWRFKDQGTRATPQYEGTQRPASHYRTMALEDICSLPVRDIVAPDAWLFLWCPTSLRSCRYSLKLDDRNPTLGFWAAQHGRGYDLAVAESWGFAPTGAEVVWIKGRIVDDDLRLHIGMGHYTRNAHETCTIYKRGNPKRVAGIPSVILAPRGKHSSKPIELYPMIERFSAGPRLELFARTIRDGWTSWGDEVPV